MKIGLLIVTTMFLQSLKGIQIEQEKARCLFSILLKSLQNISTNDEYVVNLNSLTKSDFNFSQIDSKVIQDLNSLLMNYDNFDDDLKNEILSCKLNTLKTKERCEKKYSGECIKINPIAFQKKCQSDFVLVNNYYCFPKCPENFNEMENKCQKPNGFTLTVYGNKKICEKETKGECDSYMNDSIFTGKCGKNFSKIFKTICLPQCPSGYLDGGDFCEKRKTEFLGNFFSFNFRDLFN